MRGNAGTAASIRGKATLLERGSAVFLDSSSSSSSSSNVWCRQFVVTVTVDDHELYIQ